MLKRHTPTTIRRPFANYVHAVEIPSDARILMCSGQLSVTLDDEIPLDARDQSDLCFDNIEAILEDSGMGLCDVVRVNAYVTGREHMAPYMAARDARFGDIAPASTLMIVSGFTREEFKVEIEVIAAQSEQGST